MCVLSWLIMPQHKCPFSVFLSPELQNSTTAKFLLQQSISSSSSFCSDSGRIGLVNIASILLLVEEISVAHIGVGIVTSEIVGNDLLVRVAEVDVPHVFLIVQEIGVESVVIPEVMLVIFSFQVAHDHETQESRHSEGQVGVEHGSEQVEVRPDATKLFVAGMG